MKRFNVKLTFRVIDEVLVEAENKDEAYRRAIERVDISILNAHLLDKEIDEVVKEKTL